MDLFPLTRHLDADVHVLAEVDSTNRFLRDAPPVTDRLSLALTTQQTSGRGRQDRIWVTPPGQGVALSVALPPSLTPKPIDPSWLSLLALVTGAAIAEAVAREVQDEVSVKWPNDVLVSEKKVAGVLGELTGDGRVIVGIGMNLSVPEGDLPTPHSTSLHLHGAQVEGLADRLTHSIVTTLTSRLSTPTPRLDDETTAWVTARLGTLGRRVRVDFPDGESIVGVASGLRQDGALVVAGEDGTDRVITAADVWHLRHHDA